MYTYVYVYENVLYTLLHIGFMCINTLYVHSVGISLVDKQDFGT